MQTVNNNLTLLISKNAAIPHESSVMAIIRHVRFQDVWLRVTIHMSVFVKQNVIFLRVLEEAIYFIFPAAQGVVIMGIKSSLFMACLVA